MDVGVKAHLGFRPRCLLPAVAAIAAFAVLCSDGYAQAGESLCVAETGPVCNAPVDPSLGIAQPPPVSGPVDDTGKQNRGYARLSVGSACPSRYVRMSVRGVGVANVSFFIDRRKLMTVIKPDSRGRFRYRIRTSRIAPGLHRIRAQVTFTAASATASGTLSAAVQRCRPVKPRFTG